MKNIVLKDKQKNIILCCVSILIGCIMLFPIYWIIVSSFKTNAEIFASPPTFIPKEFTLESYTSQFTDKNNILVAFLNSCKVAFTSMVLSCVLAIPAAYGLARFRMRGKKLFIIIFLTTQMLPVALILTPMFLVYKNLHLLDNIWAPILSDATISVPFVVLILRTYFLALPKELEDSAKIDGCNTFTAFTKIMLPISYPGLIMTGAFSFLYAWGDLAYSLTFLTSPEKRTMTASIYNFMGKYGIQWNAIMAYGVLLVLPVVLIFIFLQKYIIGGLTNGAVKG
ncbi:multiple sugar transport system permease protein [Clostridium saccharoperbutylacetonicum]|uniref:Carbohydrate ABC transporter membrane protein 2, CUT1 family n=1 Tax=Clostridium saccharoperbutylacetonicum N1-4(HMT) TaxID=931276 RepID=M1LPG2_9CLOT|nr:carbohydrate ABC transporter permease [Clostridium saccharoperbutylacetonicum]AGF54725.1 carbohydrate ABC transporter membrane protein 2, CUT1 family [Clostridium saccharoperbutylacetonicum N1-4(HMT)]NRT58754.1 multiple sugar transport system permease protein [Clostridium saccharoperbutylacetonicum]NSB27943.1 multiple sugar transport system permease protein [Clostridium saccharoperbutylacetonicum]NSB41426.1 multiple sugar transport system permease protein [Clostridium saccharoperbutylacetoni